MSMYELASQTDPAWIDTVLADFDRFLMDHAACERKASALAMSLVAHYPDRPALVTAMTDLAIEELAHFREVMKHVVARGLVMVPDEKDPYVNRLRKLIRGQPDHYLLDRLLVFSIVERRGTERFALLAKSLPDAGMQDFYDRLARAEARHYMMFLDLAREYFNAESVEKRLKELLEAEAAIVRDLPLRPAVH